MKNVIVILVFSLITGILAQKSIFWKKVSDAKQIVKIEDYRENIDISKIVDPEPGKQYFYKGIEKIIYTADNWPIVKENVEIQIDKTTIYSRDCGC